MTLQKKINWIDPYPDLNRVPLQFSIKCINVGKTYSYNLSKFPPQFLSLTRAFAWGLLSYRHTVGHLSRDGQIRAIRKFYIYLETLGFRHLYEPTEIVAVILRDYAHWLKQRSGAYITKSHSFRSLCNQVNQWAGRPWAAQSVVIPKGLFPGSNSSSTGHAAYSEDQFEKIKAAIKKDLRTSAIRLERKYVAQYLNQPPPIDDIAPFSECVGGGIRHNIWDSKEHRTWWWENKCHCLILCQKDILTITNGASFIRALRKSAKKQTPADTSTKTLLKEFYAELGAGATYSPKYLGKASPILYLNKWDKPQYVQWYWENHCHSSLAPHSELQLLYPDFVNAVRWHYGSLGNFYRSINVTHHLTTYDLTPYYLALLLATGLNPSTIQFLDVNCLQADPLKKDHVSISWTKLRARKKSITIPVDRMNGLSPISIINRIVALTSAFRPPGVIQLFISNNSHSGSKKGENISTAMFQKAVRRWFETHNIAQQTSSDLSVQVLSGTAVRFRPTIAQHEYKRTGKLEYVKAMLGHTRSETTTSYLNKSGDPILRHRRGIHLEAMFIGMQSTYKDAIKYISDRGMESNPSRKPSIAYPETILTHCADPKSSPIHGQIYGNNCNAHDACLYCSNLVITPYDLVRYFAFVNYQDYALANGSISKEDYATVVSERIHIFTKYVLPKYSDEVIDIARRTAKSDAPEEWRISPKPEN